MSNTFQAFDERLKKIEKNHTQLANGYSARVSRDGLIIFRPKRRSGGVSLRGLLLLVVGFFFFKGMIMAHLGTTVYDQRVEALRQGSVVEQAGAFVMQADPVTSAIAIKMHPYLK